LASGFDQKHSDMSQYFRQLLLLFALVQYGPGYAQTPVSEPLLQLAVRLTAQLPASTNDAYGKRQAIKLLFDSLEAGLEQAAPLLAERVNRRSARLNAMANINEPDAKLSLAPPNQAMTSYFMGQWNKMDALGRSFNKAAPSFYGTKQQ
jgi:hypothetical protein